MKLLIACVLGGIAVYPPSHGWNQEAIFISGFCAIAAIYWVLRAAIEDAE
jgi:hypothetical protein